MTSCQFNCLLKAHPTPNQKELINGLIYLCVSNAQYIHKTLVHPQIVNESLQIMSCNSGPRKQLYFLDEDSFGLVQKPSHYEILKAKVVLVSEKTKYNQCSGPGRQVARRTSSLGQQFSYRRSFHVQVISGCTQPGNPTQGKIDSSVFLHRLFAGPLSCAAKEACVFFFYFCIINSQTKIKLFNKYFFLLLQLPETQGLVP